MIDAAQLDFHLQPHLFLYTTNVRPRNLTIFYFNDDTAGRKQKNI